MRHVDDGTMHAWLDGQVGDPVEVARIEEHLRECAACSARLDEERAAMEQAEALLSSVAPAADASRPAFEALVKRAEHLAASSRAAKEGFHRWTYAAGWAASVTLAVALGWAARDLWSGGSDSREESRIAEVSTGQPGAPSPTQPSSPGQTAALSQPPGISTARTARRAEVQEPASGAAVSVDRKSQPAAGADALESPVPEITPAGASRARNQEERAEPSPAPAPGVTNPQELRFSLNERPAELARADTPAPAPSAAPAPTPPVVAAAPPASPQAKPVAEASREGDLQAAATPPAQPPSGGLGSGQALGPGAAAGGRPAGGGGGGGGGRGGAGGGRGGGGRAGRAAVDGLTVAQGQSGAGATAADSISQSGDWRVLPRTDAAARSGMALYGLNGLTPVSTLLSADGTAVRTIYRLDSGETVEVTQQKIVSTLADRPSDPGVATPAPAPGAGAQNARQATTAAQSAPQPPEWSQVRGDVRLTVRGTVNPAALAERLRLD